jgi:hypothetical protein
MQVKKFTTSSDLNGSKNGKFDAAGNASFKVGETLTVAANQATALYTGTFTVNLNSNWTTREIQMDERVDFLKNKYRSDRPLCYIETPDNVLLKTS